MSAYQWGEVAGAIALVAIIAMIVRDHLRVRAKRDMHLMDVAERKRMSKPRRLADWFRRGSNY